MLISSLKEKVQEFFVKLTVLKAVTKPRRGLCCCAAYIRTVSVLSGPILAKERRTTSRRLTPAVLVLRHFGW